MITKKARFNITYLNMIYCMLLLIIFSFRLPELYQLYVLHDEFGYWANAAQFTGHDWSGIASLSPYYAYGYSFLLMPLMLIFKNSIVMYRVAVFGNALLYVGSFLLAFKSAKCIFKNQSEYALSSISFFITLYCNNLLQANIAWAETLLYFIFWLMFFTLLLYCREQKLRYMVFYILETIYLYIIHQRSLGVVIAAVITILVLTGINKYIHFKRLLGLLALLAVILVFASLVKDFMVTHLWQWTDDSIAGANDYSGQMNKFFDIFRSGDNLLTLIQHVCGKFMYLIVASASLLYWGVICCARAFSSRKQSSENVPVSAIVFLLLSLLGTVGITSIYVNNACGRIDAVMYGRYIEFVAGPILLLGAGYLYSFRAYLWEYLLFLGSLFVTGFIAKPLLDGGTTFTRIMSSGSCIFYNAADDTFQLIPYLSLGLFLGTLAYVISHNKGFPFYLIGITMTVLFWFSGAQTALEQEVLPGQRYVKNVGHIEALIEEVNADVPVYFTFNDKVEDFYNRRIENLQFLMPDTKIQLTDLPALDSVTGDYYLVQYRTDNIDLNRYTVVTQGHNLVVMVPRGSALEAQCLAYTATHPYTFTDTMMYSATQSNEYAYDSEHTEGFLVFCQDLVLTPGTYRVNIVLDVSNIESPDLGSTDVSVNYGAGILYSNPINASQVDNDGQLVINYDFTCTEPAIGAEIRFYSLGNADIKLDTLEYYTP